ncbi:SWIB domain-containing protein [Megavirus baoshan]|uniref:SWIB domain-containing protein n=1 Tax=Megavirus baoshan TaxID=2496520 RepID=A0A8K1T100_9VIRU|nr:SWIB domain-containing protein [Megavirus baoshan]UFX99843.1 SWIB domain-containing protein [Megavirus baoshan]
MISIIINSCIMSKTNKNIKTNKSKKIMKSKKKTKSNSSLNEFDEYDLLINVNSNKKSSRLSKSKSIENFDEKAEAIIEKLRENYLEQKKLINDFRELRATHKKEIKSISRSNVRSNNGKLTGFNKPEPIPASLRSLLKIKEDMLPRSKITNLIYQYFTDNKMYNTKTKKEIIPDSHIKKLFGMKDDDVINFYNLQTWLKKVYDENNINNNDIIEI